MIVGFLIGFLKMIIAAAFVMWIMLVAIKYGILNVFFERGEGRRSGCLVIVVMGLFFWTAWVGLVWMLW